MPEAVLVMEFRSPLLKALPKDRFEGISERRLQRLSLSVLTVLTLSTLVILVRRKSLPQDSFYWLYWFHDHMYLPLKGFVFTRFYPWSLAWLGVGATLIFIAWLTYVVGKSPLQAPHALLVRWASRNSGLHPLMTGMAELFKRMGLPMKLFRSAVAVERAEQLESWFRLKESDSERRLRHRFLRQTDLFISLAHVFRDQAKVKEEAVSMGLATLLWMEPVTKADTKKVEHQVLNRMIARVIRLLPLPPNAEAFNEAIAFPGDFQDRSIALDVLLLFTGFVPDGEKRLSQALGNLEKDKIDFGDLVRLRLAQATEERVAFLEVMRRDLERGSLGRIALRQIETKLPAVEEFGGPVWRERAYQGLLLACHSAKLLQEPSLLARYLDAVEALAVAVEASSPSPDSPLVDLRTHGLALTHGLPTTEIYRFAAVLHGEMEEAAWQDRREVVWPEGITGTGHVRPTWALSGTYRMAAGREGERLPESEVIS